jgi:hypothetical protein
MMATLMPLMKHYKIKTIIHIPHFKDLQSKQLASSLASQPLMTAKRMHVLHLVSRFRFFPGFEASVSFFGVCVCIRPAHYHWLLQLLMKWTCLKLPWELKSFFNTLSVIKVHISYKGLGCSCLLTFVIS